MNKYQLENIITHPAEMNYVQDLPLLKELIESFPYFQASYTLLTRLLFHEKSIYTEKYIKLSAAYSGDREVLYNYLYQGKKDPAPPEPVDATPVDDNMKEVEAAELITYQLANDSISQELHNEELISAPIESLDKEIIGTDGNEENREDTLLPFSYLTIENNLRTEEVEEQAVSRQPVSENLPETNIPTLNKEERENPYRDKKIVPNVIPEVQASTLQSENSFTNWLDFLSSHKATEIPNLSATLPEFEEINTHPKVSRNDMDSIINKFIHSEPRIKRETSKAKFYNPEDMATRSVEDDGAIVTETLAKIFEKQELWAKALDAYEKLSLKNPEKSLYFADKISELKNKI